MLVILFRTAIYSMLKRYTKFYSKTFYFKLTIATSNLNLFGACHTLVI